MRLIRSPYRTYKLAFILAILSILPILVGLKQSNYSEILAFASCLTFASGFAAWVIIQLKWLWLSFVGKLLLALLHSFVLLLSIIPARYLVAEGLGLPPQDFDVTVVLTVVVLYLPVWLLVISVLTMIFYIISLVLVLLLFLGERAIDLIFMSLEIFTRRFLEAKTCLRRRLSKVIYAYLAHAMGAAAIAILAAATWGWTFDRMRSIGRPIVRLVAYFADFQQAPLYPGIEPSKRMRLHENGVVSYAERQGGEIIIAVGKVE
jgi:hypothetical protein